MIGLSIVRCGLAPSAPPIGQQDGDKVDSFQRIFKDLDMVEQLGSGIPRILQYYKREHFHFSDNFLSVTLSSSEQVTEQVQKLLLALKIGTQNRIELMHALNAKAQTHVFV